MSFKALAFKIAKPIVKAGNKAGYVLVKNGPTIAIVSGMIGLVTATVLVAKRSSKANKIIKDFAAERKDIDDRIEKAAQEKANSIINMRTVYKSTGVTLDNAAKEIILNNERKEVRKQFRSEIRSLYLRTLWRFIKLYAVPFVIGVLSCVAILGGHKTMLKRLAGVTALYKASDEAFKEYRQNVVNDLGEEADTRYRYGIENYEFETIETDSKGKETKVTETKPIAKEGGPLEFKFCAETSDAYTGNEEYDMSYLLISQNSANNRISDGKTVHVNDVLKDLAMKPIGLRGQVSGWRKDIGDGYVDYHIRKAYEPVVRDGVHLAESGKGKFKAVYYLEFNANVLYEVKLDEY